MDSDRSCLLLVSIPLIRWCTVYSGCVGLAVRVETRYCVLVSISKNNFLFPHFCYWINFLHIVTFFSKEWCCLILVSVFQMVSLRYSSFSGDQLLTGPLIKRPVSDYRCSPSTSLPPPQSDAIIGFGRLWSDFGCYCSISDASVKILTWLVNFNYYHTRTLSSDYGNHRSQFRTIPPSN